MKGQALRKTRYSAMQMLFAVACGLALSSCTRLVVVPTPAKSIDLRGQEQKLDLSFMKAGITRREEVLERLGWADIGLNQPYAFWGRWKSSHWLDVFAREYEEEERLGWQPQNLLVEFDESGLVTRQQVFGEGALVRVLDEWLSREPRVRPDRSRVLLVHPSFWADQTVREVKLVFGSDSIEFRDANNSVTIPTASITRLTCDRSSLPYDVELTFHLTERANRSEFIFAAEIPDVITIAAYLRQIHPGAMK